MDWSVVISAMVAGIAAIIVTVVIEKWGGLHGGVLATVPSTIIPAAVGIWYGSESVEAFQLAMYIVPLGLVVNALFLLLWRVVPPVIPQWALTMRLTIISLVTLAAWSLLATLGIKSYELVIGRGIESFHLSLAWLLVGLLVGFVATYEHQPAPKGERRVGALTLLARGIAAAASIGVAVWLAGIGIPMLSGIMTIFPAIFLTSMVSLWLAQGEAVPAGAIGPMMFGAQSVSMYAILVAIIYPYTTSVVGLALASIAAWSVSVSIVNIPIWLYLKSKAEKKTTTRNSMNLT